MKVLKVVGAALLAPVLGELSWSVSHDGEDRRLGVTTVKSHNSTKDCILGGYDTSNPASVYVGGPCSAKDKPADLRYVAMTTFGVQMWDSNKKQPVGLKAFSTPQMHSQNKKTHAEVGVAGYFKLESTEYTNAAVFADTTSYLSKSEFKYNTNDFVTGKTGSTYNTITQCVVPCCASPPCECKDKKCPTTQATAKPGDFKYSIMAASYDTGAGKGWKALESAYGTGDPKKLVGELQVFQSIDFTEMKADTLELFQKAGGSATKFTDLKECDVASKTAEKDCTFYTVNSIAVGAKGWEGMAYNFPQTYNRGSWKNEGSKTTATPHDTKKVVIELVKPNAANIKAMANGVGIALTLDQAKARKIVLLRYRFDISGVTATTASGSFMVYDPTVRTKSAAAANAAASNSVSAGRVASLPAATLVAAFIAAVMAN